MRQIKEAGSLSNRITIKHTRWIHKDYKTKQSLLDTRLQTDSEISNSFSNSINSNSQRNQTTSIYLLLLTSHQLGRVLETFLYKKLLKTLKAWEFSLRIVNRQTLYRLSLRILGNSVKVALSNKLILLSREFF